MKRKIKKLLVGLTLAMTLLTSRSLNQTVKAGVGETIIQTFPDINLAQAVANKVSGGDVNTILTQDMIDDLDVLNASGKGIQDVTGINILSSLRRLDLSNNQLTVLPESFGDLVNLKELLLYKNKLTSLPLRFGDLTSLSWLYLYNNQLPSLPLRFGDLTSLSWL